MEDTVTSEQENANSQDFIIPAENGYLALNYCLMKILCIVGLQAIHIKTIFQLFHLIKIF